jgi:succinate dehydrogenase hydrophobic anchor subunit
MPFIMQEISAVFVSFCVHWRFIVLYNHATGTKSTFAQWRASVFVLNFVLDHPSSLITISCAKIRASIMHLPNVISARM